MVIDGVHALMARRGKAMAYHGTCPSPCVAVTYSITQYQPAGRPGVPFARTWIAVSCNTPSVRTPHCAPAHCSHGHAHLTLFIVTITFHSLLNRKQPIRLAPLRTRMVRCFVMTMSSFFFAGNDDDDYELTASNYVFPLPPANFP